MTDSEAADQLAIMQLAARYFKAIDGLDFGGWAACFAPGGRFEGAYDGYDAHADLLRFEADSRELEKTWSVCAIKPMCRSSWSTAITRSRRPTSA